MRPGRSPFPSRPRRSLRAALTAVALTLGFLPLMGGVAHAIPSTFSIDDVIVSERDATATFTVTREGDVTEEASVTYQTSDGSAVAGEDYTAEGPTVLNFAAGDATATITIAITNDAVVDTRRVERFQVRLTEPSGDDTIADPTGAAEIVDDEGPLALSTRDASVIEGDAGTVNMVFDVIRSGDPTAEITVTFTTADVTAESPVDYASNAQTIVIPAGEVIAQAVVPVNGDTVPEPNETFTGTLSAPSGGAVVADRGAVGTIVNDDGTSDLTINDVSVIEGNTGTTNAVFTVTRTGVVTGDAGATFTTSNGTATAGSDYTATTGTVTFTGTETTKTITVPVIGDTIDEVDETFIVTLSAPTGVAALADPTGTGTIVDDDAPAATDPAVQPGGQQGYSLVASDGGIFNFGNSKFFGSTGSIRLNQPVVGMDHTPTTQGYWLVAADGGIFSFGDAKFFGSTGAIKLNKPIVGMRSTPTGNGYWLVASDGGIFSFGDAKFFGSTGAIRLNQPIVGMERTPTGNGYWLVASDGGIFSFGDAEFFGSTGAIRLNLPVVGMARTSSGDGYFLVASDGGIFSFGDAVFRGSTGAIRLNSPVTGMMVTATGTGYWLCARDGGVFAFGNAQFLGSMGATRLNQPVVGCDAPLSQSQSG